MSISQADQILARAKATLKNHIKQDGDSEETNILYELVQELTELYDGLLNQHASREELIQLNKEEISVQNEELQSQNEELSAQNEEISNSLIEVTRLNKQVNKEKQTAKHYLDIAGVIILTLDKSGAVTLANKKALELLNCDESDIIGKNWFKEFLPKDQSEEALNGFRKIMAKTASLNKFDENPIITADGAIHHIYWQNTLLYDDNNQVIGTLSSGEDITEKKTAAIKIEEQMAFLDKVMDESPIAMWIAEPDGLVIKANKSLVKRLSLNEDQLIGEYNVLLDENLIKQGLIEKVKTTFFDHKTVQFNMFWSDEVVEHTKLGNENKLWIEVTMFPILDVKGNLQNVVCQWLDVTQKKESADQLILSEQKFKNLYTNSPFGIVIGKLLRDEQGKVYDILHEEANIAAAHHTGLELDMIVGKTALELSNSQEVRDIVKKYTEVVETGKVFSYSHLFDVYKRVLSVTVYPLTGDQFIINFIDDTEKIQATEDLKSSKERLIEAQKIAKMGSYEYDIKKNLSLWSDEVYDIFGFDRNYKTPNLEEFLNGIVDEDRENFNKDYENTFLSRNTVITNYRYQLTDGTIKHIEARLNVIRDDKDVPVLIRGTVQDISAKRLAEIALILSEKKFRRLADQLPVPLCTFNSETEDVTYINHKFTEVFGYTSDKLRTIDDWLRLAYPDEAYRTWVIENWNKTVTNAISLKSEIAPYEYIITDKNGKKHNTIISGVIIENEIVVTLIDITAEKEAREVIKKSEEQLNLIFNSTTDFLALIAIKPEGYFLESTNEAYFRAINLINSSITKERLKNLEIKQLIKLMNWPIEVAHTIEDYYQQAIASKLPLVITETIPGEANKDLILKSTYTPIINKDNECRYILYSSHDITSLKETEAALIQSEEKYRLIADNASDVIWVFDLTELKYRYVSPSIERLLGYTSDELVRQDPTTILAPSSLTFMKQEMPTRIKNLQQGKSEAYRDILEIIHKDGHTLWIEMHANYISKKSGEGFEVLGASRDISERLNFESALKDSKERFELAMKAAEDGLYDWDLENNTIYYSPAWKKMLGFQDHELLNDFSVWEDYTHPDDVKRSWQMLEDHISGKIDRFEIEFKMKHKEGHWVDILSRAEAVFNPDGKATRIVGTHVDITDRKKIKQELQEHKDHLEILVKERTKELEIKNKELEHFNSLFVGREFRINELKEEIKRLKSTPLK